MLPPYRMLLLPASLVLFTIAVRTRFKLLLPDFFILFGVLWISVAMFITTGGLAAISATVANTVDIAFSYFFARIIFRTPRDFRIFLVYMAPAIALIGIIMVLESVLHRAFVYEIFSGIFGETRRMKFVERIGLLRAFGPFPHPILAGLFLASFLPLYALAGIKGWPRWAGILASFGSFFSLSSAALLALVVSLVLIAYNWLTEKVQQLRWKVALIAGTVIGLVLEFGSENGAFNVLARYASFNTVTARHRLTIWEHGSKSVEQNPWFGIGYEDWERPTWMLSSVDHYWLLMAMQYGAVVPFIIGFAVFLAIVSASRASVVGPLADRALLRGLAISLSVFAFGVFSVSIWLSVQAWFYILVGVCVTLSARALDLSKMAQAARAQEQLLRSVESAAIRS